MLDFIKNLGLTEIIILAFIGLILFGIFRKSDKKPETEEKNEMPSADSTQETDEKQA
jgi:Na+/H+ antiporter NhaD/arsenite permease-like protein